MNLRFQELTMRCFTVHKRCCSRKNLSFSSHKGVISAFGEHFVKTGIFLKEMGRELNRAFEKRQLGDYEYTFVISKIEAEEMLESGKKFVDEIVQYLKEKRYYNCMLPNSVHTTALRYAQIRQSRTSYVRKPLVAIGVGSEFINKGHLNKIQSYSE
ncbi:hypothetical protein FHEFKHOI_00323 [Candidatus Methanoperedenaceae archaeon GB50]|nr:hypothetical protein FHEFKHOI_00323 [Candidatus Methanoperedenaceae archaeon GB50]CAD7779227.1 MAG: hypothetical protein KBONHNOK_01277 [Candidatus Methanoperedenaceae archaeon GB50]